MEDEGKILNEMEAILREMASRLYPEKIFDYGKNPRHYGEMEKPDGYAEKSDECGRDIKMFLRVRNGRIEESRFMAEGCIFTVAACDAAAEMSRGRTIGECLKINRSSISEHLGGVPVDHGHCALLAALLFQKALRSYIEKNKIKIKE